MVPKLLLAVLVPVVGLSAAGCGLISSDVTQFDLGLPHKQFTVDAGNWGLSNPELLLSHACTVSPLIGPVARSAAIMAAEPRRKAKGDWRIRS